MPCRRVHRGNSCDRFGVIDQQGVHAPYRRRIRRTGFTFSLISTLSVTTGNDNRLIIADKSPIPADKDVRIQKMIIGYLSVIIDKNRQ